MEAQVKTSLIASALIKAQGEMSNPTKGSNNPYFKSRYADLNAVREAVIPVLNANGIAVLQPIVQLDGKNFVKTMLLHTSGETIESLTEIIYSKPNDAQAQGSGITYARRYGLQSLVCIGAEDDDGNRASQPQPQAKQPQAPAPADDNLLIALAEVKEATSVDGLEDVWKRWAGYHNHPQFRTATMMRKGKLEHSIKN